MSINSLRRAAGLPEYLHRHIYQLSYRVKGERAWWMGDGSNATAFDPSTIETAYVCRCGALRPGEGHPDGTMEDALRRSSDLVKDLLIENQRLRAGILQAPPGRCLCGSVPIPADGRAADEDDRRAHEEQLVHQPIIDPIDAIRARHVIDVGKADIYCKQDGKPWPCDTAIVLAALDAREAEWDAAFNDEKWGLRAVRRNADAAIEREARLRVALHGYHYNESLHDYEIPGGRGTHCAICDVLDPPALATTPEGE